MDNYTNEELTSALREVSSTISKCEKMLGKLAEGTSQHSLLRNRIKAMVIAKRLIENERTKREQSSSDRVDDRVKRLESDRKNVMGQYTKEINRIT